jgi:hypothetical protein
MLVFVASAAGASAGVCDTLIIQERHFGPSTPNYTQFLTFNQFNIDPNLVCDISVNLDLYIGGGFLGVDNDGEDPATVTVQLGATAAIDSTDVILLNNAFQHVTGTAAAWTGSVFNLAGDDGDGPNNVDLSAPDGAIHTGTFAEDLLKGKINSQFWGGYLGNGTFTIRTIANQILDFGSVGGVEGAFSPVTAWGTVRVKILIPEPSTIAFLALGGLAALRRRR